MTRVKICGLCRPEDVEFALSLGADAVGFILEPTSKRCVAESDASQMAMLAGPYATAVSVYGACAGKLIPNILAYQACAFSDSSEIPAWNRILTVRLQPGTTAMASRNYGVNAGAVHLDPFVQGSYGGTGQRVDWEIAAEIVRLCLRPVILAGGLTPDNVAEAIAQVHPYAVDVSSGVESSPRVKDYAKLKDFVQAVRG